jgi:predicted house-cleaning NTP pyrophosphatase (Maf/HAM1 superfamily)
LAAASSANPADAGEAAEFLYRALSGRRHRVITARRGAHASSAVWERDVV